MRILLANDDGIHADGFAVLEDIAASLGGEIWCVAPEADRSGVAHSQTHVEPLRVRQLDERRFVLRGTPADCIIIAIRALMPEPPDLILSGVNLGVNIADEIIGSGTIGATIEGALFGIPSIALSQDYNIVDGRRTFNWDISRKNGPRLIQKLLEQPHQDGIFYSINFPNCRNDELQAPRIVAQGRREHGYDVERRVDGRGFPYFWLRSADGRSESPPGSDVEAMAQNAPTISALQFDLTHYAQNERLRGIDFAK